ncbi:hypothetical protein [Corallococcus sicarius]|uniref:Uncharacterized protein n=1 Tax=Corallococcus sicarius TaxID=2316726 RepID=A0A3A8N8N9_9BACT|nr:hypothetical protein [Corallococcus sicarius]RKH40656.1 hypothetical protein D7X12_20295 [Corallococcus sicarius]
MTGRWLGLAAWLEQGLLRGGDIREAFSRAFAMTGRGGGQWLALSVWLVPGLLRGGDIQEAFSRAFTR